MTSGLGCGGCFHSRNYHSIVTTYGLARGGCFHSRELPIGTTCGLGRGGSFHSRELPIHLGPHLDWDVDAAFAVG